MFFSVIVVIEAINEKRKCSHKIQGIQNSGVLGITDKITSNVHTSVVTCREVLEYYETSYFGEYHFCLI